MLEHGFNIVTISKLYGHSSVLVTQRYLHPQDKLSREAVESLVSPQHLAQIGHKTKKVTAKIRLSHSFSVN
jgi:site-specific recombinase XerD